MQSALDFLRILEKIRSPFTDTLFQLITRLGEEVIVLGFICILYWCINKNSAYRLGIVFFVSGILVQALKVTFRIDRPWVIDSTLKPVASAVEGATGYSFPSGHTQSATALYGYIAAVTDKHNIKGKIIFTVMLTLIALVGFSRMYLGVHTPFDVAASLAVTLISVFAILRFWDRISLPSADLTVALTLGMISVALCVYSFAMVKSGIIGADNAFQINDCFKSGGAGAAFALGYYLERKYLKFEVSAPKIWIQVLKIIFGVSGALVFKSLPKLIAEGNLAVDFIRYFLTVLWVLLIYPWIFSRIIRNDIKDIKK